VAVDTITFTPDHPTDGKYDGVVLHGLRFRVTDRRRYDPTEDAVRLLLALRRTYPRRFEIRPAQFDRLAGRGLRQDLERGRSLATMMRGWAAGLAFFRDERAKYLLY
jgi:uncharacterized protein YbbC (DUF1343 family)